MGLILEFFWPAWSHFQTLCANCHPERSEGILIWPQLGTSLAALGMTTIAWQWQFNIAEVKGPSLRSG